MGLLVLVRFKSKESKGLIRRRYHFQFADDTIFFSNTREEELQTLKSFALGIFLGSRATWTRVIFMPSILIRIIFLGWLSCLIARLLVGLYSIWVFLWEGIPRLVAFEIQ